MAFLKEAFILCRLPSEEELVGVCDGNKEDQVIVSCKSKGISIIKISNQKLLHCWSPRQLHTITSPVIWDTSHEQLVAVHNSKVIRRWTLEEMNFEEAKKKNVEQLIYKVFPVMSGHVIVVYHSGCIEFLGESICYKNLFPNEDQLKWCWVNSVEGKLTVFFLTKVPNGNLLTLRLAYYTTATDTWASNSIELPVSEGTLLDCCYINSDQTSSTVFFLWSNKNILRIKMDPEKDAEVSKMYALSSVSSEAASIVSLSSTHMAIVPVKKNGQDGVGIFDLQFGTLNAWQLLPQKLKTHPKLFCSNSHLFIACDKMLYTYAYELQSFTLSNLLCNTQQLADDDHLLQTIPMVTSWNTNEPLQNKINDDGGILMMFSNIFNKLIASNPATFHKEVEKLLKLLTHERNQHWWNSIHMVKLILSFCNQKSLWSSKLIRMLIYSGHFSIQSLPDLFKALIDHKEVHLLDLALQRLTNIPEICLAKAIEFYLSLDNKEKLSENGIEEAKMEVDEPNCPVSQQTAHYLCQILTCSFGNIFLIEALKTIPFQYIVVLLKFLNYQLMNASALPSISESQPSMLQIVDWVSVTIDAHVTQLVISPDTKDLLHHLYYTVGNEVQFVDELAHIEAQLTQLEVRNTFVSKDEEVGQYCIRFLHIP
ncbi:unnamed protein product [Acanthosepion pharaonis]|uniref:Nucleolar protein 11 n=1 Tax=Acanthosepion pharaonis TaxID=158019 RepID=A0A812CZL5_ACAPH|nr:unnamed protein product [Sepia pharaonis]